MDRSRRSLTLSLAAWAAISAMLLETAFPVVAFAVNSMPGTCQCSASGGECKCAGGCCSGKKVRPTATCCRPAAKKSSCCSSNVSTGTKSCCQKKTQADTDLDARPACCRAREVDQQIKKKASSDNAPIAFEGHCGCGDRPDTLTGEAPPRLVPVRQSTELFLIEAGRVLDRGLLYPTISLEPESPPPQDWRAAHVAS